MPQATLTIKGMSCGHCVNAVTRALESVPGVARVEVSLEEGTATMEVDETVYTEQAAREAVSDAGYSADRHQRPLSAIRRVHHFLSGI